MNRVEQARKKLRDASAELEAALKETSKVSYDAGGAAYYERLAAENKGAWKRTYLAYAKCIREGGHHMKPMYHSMGDGFAGMRCSVCSYSEYN